MRGRIVTALATAILLLVLCFIFTFYSFTSSAVSIFSQYPYLQTNTPPWNPPITKGFSDDDPGTRRIVKVRLEHEDVSWIDDLFPIWRKQVVTVPRVFSSVHQGGMRVDKGRVAESYLTWIIENYEMLPETVVFLSPDHPKRPGSRIESDRIRASIPNLQIPYVQEVGFAPLTCPSALTCASLIHPFDSPPTSLHTLEVSMSEAWHGIFGDVPVPENVTMLPTAEFAVSKAQIRKRNPEEYLKMWTWLNKTKMDDDSVGAVFEFVWNVVFGQKAMECIDEKECECKLWGRC